MWHIPGRKTKSNKQKPQKQPRIASGFRKQNYHIMPAQIITVKKKKIEKFVLCWRKKKKCNLFPLSELGALGCGTESINVKTAPYVQTCTASRCGCVLRNVSLGDFIVVQT